MQKTAAENLFRKEAVAALRRIAPGRPVCRSPASWSWATGLLLLVLTAACAAAPYISYHRIESARGFTVADNGVARIRHTRASRVLDVLVQDGQFVEQGDELIVVTDDLIIERDSTESGLRVEAVREELRHLQKQRTLLAIQSEARLASIESEIDELDVELSLVSQQVEISAASASQAADKLARLELAGDAVSEWDRLREVESARQARLRHAGLAREQGRLHRELRERSSERNLVVLDTELRLAQLDSEYARLEQKLASTRAAARSLLVAPLAGTVTSVSVQSGQYVEGGRSFCSVVPPGHEFAVDVWVSSRAAPLLRVGQIARIEYDAYPRSVFGNVEGRIALIAEVPTLPAEMPGELRVADARYRVRVAVTSGTDLRLMPGMALTANFILEARSLADWFLESLRGHA